VAADVILDPRFAAEVVDACAAVVVVLGVLLVATRSIGRSIWLVGLQSAFVGGAALAVGLATGAGHLALGGLLAIGAKGIVVPLVLGSILHRSSVRRERHLLLGSRVLLVAAVAIVFASAAAADGVTSGTAVAASRVLPAAISQVLMGLLIVMTRRKALSLVVGLLVFENGITLTAFSLSYGMPLVVELGVLFDVMIVVVVAWIYTRRMLDVFGSTSTDELRSLRG
jgi:hydrogenase-4 component E